MMPFQFTRARGARHAILPACQVVNIVSIHARTGRATPARFRSRHGGRFQFTRARGARRTTSKQLGQFHRFNSRAHGARDAPTEHHRQLVPVSIHARTGRATPRASVRAMVEGFNSRAHGARDNGQQAGKAVSSVSIHARTGRATGVVCGRDDVQHVVSIHARTGRATRSPMLSSGSRGFNSRAHGARDSQKRAPKSVGEFQFTRARGARLPRRGRKKDGAGFNSRAHGARDGVLAPGVRDGEVSIHARTGRATTDGQ